MAILSSSASSVASNSVERTFASGTARTYTASAPEVGSAVIRAIGRMGFRITKDRTTRDHIRDIRAQSTMRYVDVVIMPVASNATRLSIIVDSGSVLSRNSATETELLLQTTAQLETIRKEQDQATNPA